MIDVTIFGWMHMVGVELSTISRFINGGIFDNSDTITFDVIPHAGNEYTFRGQIVWYNKEFGDCGTSGT